MKAECRSRATRVVLWRGTVAASLHDGGAAGQTLLQRTTGIGPGAALALVDLFFANRSGSLDARAVVARLVEHRALSPRYAVWQRTWEGLGDPAFVAMLAVYFLMVNKPALGSV